MEKEMMAMQADAVESLLIGLAASSVLIALGKLVRWIAERIIRTITMRRKR